MTPLLDVNVLVALAWPTHLHHDTAVDWFISRNGEPWATTSVVQLGFIRVCSNQRVLDDARSPREAASVMRALTEMTGHEFWIDDVEPAHAQSSDRAGFTGHQQVTDVHLLSLAERHDGCVVTFDKAMAVLSTDPQRVHILESN